MRTGGEEKRRKKAGREIEGDREGEERKREGAERKRERVREKDREGRGSE